MPTAAAISAPYAVPVSWHGDARGSNSYFARVTEGESAPGDSFAPTMLDPGKGPRE